MTAVESAGTDTETVDPHEVSRAELDEMVRHEFDLPDQLDPALEEPFGSVVDALYDDDLDAALERSADVPESPCETVNPELYPVDADHGIACLLYDDEFAAARARTTVIDTGDAPADD